jgi:hypothetical protein
VSVSVVGMLVAFLVGWWISKRARRAGWPTWATLTLGFLVGGPSG